MSITGSLLISAFGFSIVFIVLIALSFLIKLQSFVLGKFFKDSKIIVTAETPETPETSILDSSLAMSTGELKLINVDEPTAAMIMAIVSDETKIPLEELRFISIKALD